MNKQLTSEQRYTISVLLQNGTKEKDIAKELAHTVIHLLRPFKEQIK